MGGATKPSIAARSRSKHKFIYGMNKCGLHLNPAHGGEVLKYADPHNNEMRLHAPPAQTP
jgi:hypothetical protein